LVEVAAVVVTGLRQAVRMEVAAVVVAVVLPMVVWVLFALFGPAMFANFPQPEQQTNKDSYVDQSSKSSNIHHAQ